MSPVETVARTFARISPPPHPAFFFSLPRPAQVFAGRPLPLGSGRVPAALSNIVGLKPSLGLVSTAGLVPACRTLDCVSVFALTTDDAFAALMAIAGPDAADPYSRPRAPGSLGAVPNGIPLGV